MGKYDPLKSFLEAHPGAQVPMCFAEIERLLGFKLPKSKQYPAWWSNSPTNNVMTKVWLEAGFMTEQVDTAAERLVFRRVENTANAGRGSPPVMRGGRYPGFGALKGTVKFAEGFDPTEPADPEWGKLYE